MKVTYKITYHNLKIYVGVDMTGTLRHFGVPNPPNRAQVRAWGLCTRRGGLA